MDVVGTCLSCEEISLLERIGMTRRTRFGYGVLK